MARMSALASMVRSIKLSRSYYKRKAYGLAAEAARSVIKQWDLHWQNSSELEAHEAHELYREASLLLYKSLVASTKSQILRAFHDRQERKHLLVVMRHNFDVGDPFLERVLRIEKSVDSKRANAHDDRLHPIADED